MAAKPRTRRTGAAPNRDHHEPSSSRSRRRPSHFFKIILPSSMHHMKLRLPEKFVSKFGDELSTVAILSVPDGCIWQVGLEKADKKIWFRDGWKDFVEHHSILHGYFLVFKYEGNSKFHVLIFDMTATEIQYPSDGNDKRSKRFNSEYQNDIKESRQCQVNDDEMSSEHELPAKCEGDKEKFWRKGSDMFTGRKFKVSRGRERAIQAATKLKTRNPFFISTIRPYNLYNSFLIACPIC